MADPELYETFQGFKIWHRPGKTRRPWRSEIPGNPDHLADHASLPEARAFIFNRKRILAHRRQADGNERELCQS